MERTARPSPILALAAFAVVVAGLKLAREVLIPLALALLLAFLLAPIASRLQRLGLRRAPSVVLVVVLVFVAVGLLGWMITGELTALADKLPEYQHNLQARLASLWRAVESPLQKASGVIEEVGKELAGGADAGGSAPTTVQVRDSGDGLIGWLQAAVGHFLHFAVVAGMVLLLTMVMLLRREDLRDRMLRLATGRGLHVTTRALADVSSRVARYLLAQTTINVAYGTAVGVGLWLIGLPSALMWGLLSGLLRFVPYAGPLVASGLPIFLSLAVSEGWRVPLLTGGLFLVLELIVNNFIEPWLYGNRTGITPLAILVAALFFTWLWGPVGLILSTPLTVCLAVAGKHVPQLGFLAVLLSDEPALDPPARLYQRLLADDLDEAWDQVRPVLEKGGLAAAGDVLLLPALSRAEADRKGRDFDAEAERRLWSGMGELIDQAAAERVAADQAREAEAAPEPRAGRPLRVALLPAHDEADHLAARLLGEVLARRGATVHVAPAATLVAEMSELADRRGVDVACISVVPPAGFTHARYLCKRLRERLPDLPLVLCLWGEDVEETAALERLQCGDVRVATSLATARSLVLHQGLVSTSGATDAGAPSAGARAAAAS